jgi:transcriptional regulator with XRE-family HTH domain
MMVGRPEKALDVRYPIQAFAQQLRDLRRGCDGMTYAEMASRCNYSAATLSEAARGATMPSWEVAAAYVAACGATWFGGAPFGRRPRCALPGPTVYSVRGQMASAP